MPNRPDPRPAPHEFRVLIVDDSEVNRLVMAAILDTFAISHASVCDGVAAVEAATTGDFGAILMDIQMPVMDGLEATRRIRQWEAGHACPRTPIHMVSANGQPFVAPSVDAGADGFLHKPVSVTQLIEVLGPLMAAAAKQLAA
jgi:CheY-like chemotaxis protein